MRGPVEFDIVARRRWWFWPVFGAIAVLKFFDVLLPKDQDRAVEWLCLHGVRYVVLPKRRRP